LTDHHVMRYMESFPYLLLAQLSEDKRIELSKTVLHSFIEDQEMLETLHNYFYYNLNISETAKNMYMHRYSIQYRIDKFIKETNIYINRFNDDVSVKVAMLAKTLTQLWQFAQTNHNSLGNVPIGKLICSSVQ